MNAKVAKRRSAALVYARVYICSACVGACGRIAASLQRLYVRVCKDRSESSELVCPRVHGSQRVCSARICRVERSLCICSACICACESIAASLQRLYLRECKDRSESAALVCVRVKASQRVCSACMCASERIAASLQRLYVRE